MKKLDDIKKIAVLGSGVMGPGIAQIFAIGGYDVTIWIHSKSEEKKKNALQTLHKGLETFAEEDMIDAGNIEDIFARVSCSFELDEAVADADLVLEAVTENRNVKEDLYKQLQDLMKEDAILASNTSALNIFEILPERLEARTVITHWYSPPQLVPLVEVVKGEKTPQDFCDVTVELLEKCGKTPVVMKKFIRGYIANRLQMCLNQEVFYLLDNGYCTPEDIDKAAKTSFIPRAVSLGICKRMDFGGLDMTENNFKNKSYQMPELDEIPSSLRAHTEKGELGVKTGKGWYDYTGVDRQELMAKRDKQLFEVFKLAKKFMDDPV